MITSRGALFCGKYRLTGRDKMDVANLCLEGEAFD